jgi:predicted tellurium resistance membrane protein TerC
MSSFFRTDAKLIRAFFNMPRFLRFGVVVFVVSGGLDLLYHGISAFWPGMLDPYLGPDGYYVHLALFFGMVFIIIGVIRTKPRPDSVVWKPINRPGINAQAK